MQHPVKVGNRSSSAKDLLKRCLSPLASLHLHPCLTPLPPPSLPSCTDLPSCCRPCSLICLVCLPSFLHFPLSPLTLTPSPFPSQHNNNLVPSHLRPPHLSSHPSDSPMLSPRRHLSPYTLTPPLTHLTDPNTAPPHTCIPMEVYLHVYSTSHLLIHLYTCLTLAFPN